MHPGETFFTPDYTVDPGIAPGLRVSALVGYHHRSGIEVHDLAPCPEGINLFYITFCFFSPLQFSL
jgi:hypothetical protein